MDLYRKALQSVPRRANCGGVTSKLEQLETELQAAQDEVQRCKQELASLRSERLRLQESEKHALHRALHDDVTTLPNRSYFRQRLDSALQSTADVSVFYIDLDAFKTLNDIHGHHVGDDVLKILGKRMTSALRTGDVVSRFGGDEFACLLVGVPTFDHLAQLARQLLKATSMPVDLGAGQISLQISIGIARFPADGLTPDALLQSADMAMYQAKRQRTGYAFYRPPSNKVGVIARPQKVDVDFPY